MVFLRPVNIFMLMMVVLVVQLLINLLEWVGLLIVFLIKRLLLLRNYMVIKGLRIGIDSQEYWKNAFLMLLLSLRYAVSSFTLDITKQQVLQADCSWSLRKKLKQKVGHLQTGQMD